MQRLTKDMLTERETLVKQLTEAYERLEGAINDFNQAMRERWEAVYQAAGDFNDVVAQANDWKDTVAGEIRAYMEERSERWHDSGRGQAYEAWAREYEHGDVEAVDLDCPDDLELDIDNQVELLEGLTEEV